VREAAMISSNRRKFLQAGAWTGVAFAQSAPPTGTTVPLERRVYLVGDGVTLSPGEYAALLTKIIEERKITGDTYLEGGAVAQLEQQFAKLLGKERALFLPTGTLANHLAVRELAGDKRRVIVQQESHLYCDENDCAQRLSGLNLIPLVPGHATFKLDDVVQVVDRSSSAPYPAPVGAISIESPVRRTSGQVFDFDEMKKICAYAREKKIGTHLDGARMFLASPYSGISPAQYSEHFDTVYVSLYKYFNAPFGAILAGPAPLLKTIAALRHPFGSQLYHAWEPAAIALHYLDGFTTRYAAAVRNAETLCRLLAAQGKFQIEPIEQGSNIVRLKLSTGTADILRERLARAGIVIRSQKDSQVVLLQINETLNRRTPQEIALEFSRAQA
jgi:threonine aldolase